MHATFSIQVNVTDNQALWDAAAANAVSSGSHESRAAYKAEFGLERITDHLRFLLDRPLTLKAPSGFEVVDSYCDVDAAPTPEGNVQITLIAVHKELSEHPESGSRDEAFATLGAARVMLETCLETIPDNSVGEIFDHVRFALHEITTDVDGLPRNEANELIKSVADALGPVVEKIVGTGDEAAAKAPGPLSHLGPPPEVPEGCQLFVARQERDAIIHYESYVIAEDESEAKATAGADECKWVQSGLGELDDRTITIIKPSDY
ncbi:MAG: hypothetical protein DI537_10140 [Stutzerimonas stutzeri]|nr:MAG: hypothetical protein DI537_10140 [Stutzerimonas stutzeri]